jgi:hypothetical protein
MQLKCEITALNTLTHLYKSPAAASYRPADLCPEEWGIPFSREEIKPVV